MIQPRGQVRRPGCGQMAHYGSHSAGVLPGWSVLSGGLVWTPCPPLPAGMLWGGGGGLQGEACLGGSTGRARGSLLSLPPSGRSRESEPVSPNTWATGWGAAVTQPPPAPAVRPSVRRPSVHLSIRALPAGSSPLTGVASSCMGESRPPVEVCAVSTQGWCPRGSCTCSPPSPFCLDAVAAALVTVLHFVWTHIVPPAVE